MLKCLQYFWIFQNLEKLSIKKVIFSMNLSAHPAPINMIGFKNSQISLKNDTDLYQCEGKSWLQNHTEFWILLFLL